MTAISWTQAAHVVTGNQIRDSYYYVGTNGTFYRETLTVLDPIGQSHINGAQFTGKIISFAEAECFVAAATGTQSAWVYQSQKQIGERTETIYLSAPTGGASGTQLVLTVSEEIDQLSSSLKSAQVQGNVKLVAMSLAAG